MKIPQFLVLSILSLLLIQISYQANIINRRRLASQDSYETKQKAINTVQNDCHKNKVDPKELIKVESYDKQTVYQIKHKYYRSLKNYTQGQKYLGNNQILESTGLRGLSKIQILDYSECKNGFVASTKLHLDQKYFGEGADLIKLNNHKQYVFQLTWKHKVMLVYYFDEKTFTQVATLKMPKQIEQGWGMTHNILNNEIYVTDGSTMIFTCKMEVTLDLKHDVILEAKGENEDFKFTCDKGREVSWDNLGVTHNIHRLNELEYHEGFLYLNQYLTDNIYKLDIANWTVVKKYDMSYLASDVNRYTKREFGRYLKNGECMNGITYNFDKQVFMLTGKHWPIIYEIKWE